MSEQKRRNFLKGQSNTDEVASSSQVVGTITPYHGQLYYDGRPQGKAVWGETEGSVIIELLDIKLAIKEDCGQVFSAIYPSPAWEYRIRVAV